MKVKAVKVNRAHYEYFLTDPRIKKYNKKCLLKKKSWSHKTTQQNFYIKILNIKITILFLKHCILGAQKSLCRFLLTYFRPPFSLLTSIVIQEPTCTDK